MGLFDIFKKNKALPRNDYSAIFHQIVSEANAKSSTYHFQAYDTLLGYRTIAEGGQDKLIEFLFACFPLVLNSWKDQVYSGNSPWSHGLRLIGVIIKDVRLSDKDILKISEGFKKVYEAKIHSNHIPCKILISKIESEVRERGINPTLEKALHSLIIKSDYPSADERKLNGVIYFLLQGNPKLEINKHDVWGKVVIQYFSNLDDKQQQNWIRLFQLAKQASGKNEPTAKWLKEAQPIIETIGVQEFVTKMIEWLLIIKNKIQEIHKDKEYRFDFMRDENHDIFKGLIWCAGLLNDAELNTTLDDYAMWAYKKKPGVGPISAKTGTACMSAFSMLPIKEGVSRLSKFRSKIKNNTILKSIDKFIRKAAEKNGVALQEIQELAVPDFNIKNGSLELSMGDSTAIYTVEEGIISWRKGDKIQKSVPIEVKENFSEDLKKLRKTTKEIDSLLSVIKDRLEKSYLDQRTWDFKSWSELYLLHPLTSVIAKKLIWHFFDDEHKAQGIFISGRIEDVNGDEITWINGSVRVQLWHPIGFTLEEILALRNFLTKHNIVQPFKQAYREVYILTDAELRTESYSNRFAAHILRQHQFAALCRQRGWHYTLMGNWDSHNTPYINIPSWDLTAHFFVNSDWQEAAANEMGIFNYITTDQIRFTRNNQPIILQDVPAMVFTEIMRDVDLFVGVTSLGNDPAWQDGGDAFMNTYWREYSFKDLTESALIRKEVLQSLIPKLKIASQCSFDKKFLIVNGKVRTYKIHMGSGNILMEPNDQYLCIVPDGTKRTKENLFLPFEGDNLLSIILSKALLLADDENITDKTILSQINRK